MATRIKLRRDTTANWMDVNPILANGEMGIEADTRRVKIGDGSTSWNNLKYAFTDQLRVDGKTINSEMGVSIASQDPETWVSTVKAKGNWAGTDGVAYDSMGNLYLSGWEEFGYNGIDGGSGKAFLTKFDSKGEVLWSKYTNLDGYTEGGGVIVDSEDNSIVATLDWENNYFSITKYNEDGTVVWQKNYVDQYDYANGQNLAVDNNNDIVIVGRRPDPDHDDYRAIFATKIAGDTGEVMWSRTMGRYHTDAWQPSVAIDGSNNVIIAGMDSYIGEGQANIAKLTTNGNLVWIKRLANPEGQFDGYELDLGSIDADEDGNIYFVGSYLVPKFVTDLNNDTWDGRAGLILKMNGDGVVQWSRIVGPGDCEDMGAQIVYKSGKLYATFQTERKYYKNDQFRNWDNGITTQEIVLACYDVNNGRVLWQNNFGPEVLWGWSNPSGTSANYQDTSNYCGRLIAVHGDYVAMAGQAGVYSRVEDNDIRSYGFLAQLPADGTEMDLAGWEYTESKHRGLYAKLKTDDYTDYAVNATTSIVASTVNNASQDTAGNVRIELLTAGANQWDFKPNGDLALPVGGNIEISRATQGSINVVGYFDSVNDDGLFNIFNSVTTDADGNQYYVGQWNYHGNWTPNGNRSMPMVVKVNSQGEVEWKVRLSNAYLYNNAAVYGSANAVAYDPASGNIVVVATDSGEGNSEQMLIVDMNTVTGDVVESHRYDASDDIRPNGITVNAQGERLVTGTIQGNNYLSFTVTNSMVVGGHVDTLQVPKTVFTGHTSPDWIVGTNGWSIDETGSNLNTIDYYSSISGTVRQGSDATFTIDYNSGSYAVSVISAGIKYRVGHKIKVLGSLLGGVNGDNDAIITVDSLINLAEGNIATASIYGTASETGSFPYTGVTGTNYNTGSGFTIDVQVNSETGNMIVYHNQGGSNYVVEDVITFPGTSLGGTSPAQDIVITPLQVGGFSGDVQTGEGTGYAVTDRGTSPLTYVRLQFSGANFTSGGLNFHILHYTDANTFLAKFVSTATTSTSIVWAKWIEKSNYDNGVAIDYDSEGNLYWLSRVYDQTSVGSGDWYDQPLVVKLDSDGNTQWAKTFLIDGYEGQPVGLQVDSEDYVVLGQMKYANGSQNDKPVIQRMTGDGDLLWSKKFEIDGGEGSNGQGGLALDNDDNIYFNAQRYDGENTTSWTVKLDIQNGNQIWQQEVSNERRWVYHGWNTSWSNSIATDGNKFYIGVMTNDLDGNEGNALAIALPADGTAANTQQGPFAINEQFYGAEGGNGNNGWNDPVVRPYSITDASDKFTEITANYADGGRDPIQSWLEPGPTSYYPVYTHSDAGIVFGDGTTQSTSGQGIPQVKHNRYGKTTKLKLSDSGKHLYMRNSDQTVIVPSYSEVEFPVGTVITIVNISGGWVRIGASDDGGRTQLYCPSLDGNEGTYGYTAGWQFNDNGGGNLITLLKVEEGYSNGTRWVISGNNGQRWN
jgi:hypothetical protein